MHTQGAVDASKSPIYGDMVITLLCYTWLRKIYSYITQRGRLGFSTLWIYANGFVYGLKTGFHDLIKKPDFGHKLRPFVGGYQSTITLATLLPSPILWDVLANAIGTKGARILRYN